MERLERRAIGRVTFPSRGVVVVCDTQEVLHVAVRDLGPIGVGIRAEAGTPNLLGKDVGGVRLPLCELSSEHLAVLEQELAALELL